MGAARRLVDADTGEAIQYASYAFTGDHIQVDRARVAAITESKDFTPSLKVMVLWWIGLSLQGMAPLRATGADIAKKVGMTADAVGKINRKLLKQRILIERGRIGNCRLYRISPYIAFHGTGIEQREAIKTCNPPDIPRACPMGQVTRLSAGRSVQCGAG
ncbi:MarR family transcriptional regulator [Streptomyces sp. NBC_00124]|uniref:MarR family transcriptional regulator n=1 Tax=Streptomyces sp. NBC_00124 TaxID=2975662 RepID=UPI00225956FA|nr:MarR family transcriptional regulator [Streptomyces sp. NBC_00124]MCX5367243.1 MarR family transcriptional regulator [Streptomyces sp. NBC_00124]